MRRVHPDKYPLQFYLPKEMKEVAEAHASKTGRTVSDIMRAALSQYLTRVAITEERKEKVRGY